MGTAGGIANARRLLTTVVRRGNADGYAIPIARLATAAQRLAKTRTRCGLDTGGHPIIMRRAILPIRGTVALTVLGVLSVGSPFTAAICSHDYQRTQVALAPYCEANRTNG